MLRVLAALVALSLVGLAPVSAACTATSCTPNPEPLIQLICDNDLCPGDTLAEVCEKLGYPAQGGSCLHAVWCIVKEIGLQRPVC